MENKNNPVLASLAVVAGVLVMGGVFALWLWMVEKGYVSFELAGAAWPQIVAYVILGLLWAALYPGKLLWPTLAVFLISPLVIAWFGHAWETNFIIGSYIIHSLPFLVVVGLWYLLVRRRRVAV